MQIFSTPVLLPDSAHGAVVALGNFDGLHKGHQVVLAAAHAEAKTRKKPFGVVTFEPHPRRIFFPDHPPFRLTPVPVKRRLLEEMGVNVLFEIPFTPEFSKLPAEKFVQDILEDGLNISHAVAGYDFVFGNQRKGTIGLMRQLLAKKNVGVTEITPIMDKEGSQWSSTRIREALAQGKVQDAAHALGRLWEIEGEVVAGDKRGSSIGVPTANIDLGDTARPRFGVYAVEVRVGGKSHKGVANIGVRPTVDGKKEVLEVHIFDFSGQLYGKWLRVNLAAFIRDERRFDNIGALKAQIAQDCLEAKRLLA